MQIKFSYKDYVSIIQFEAKVWIHLIIKLQLLVNTQMHAHTHTLTHSWNDRVQKWVAMWYIHIMYVCGSVCVCAFKYDFIPFI